MLVSDEACLMGLNGQAGQRIGHLKSQHIWLNFIFLLLLLVCTEGCVLTVNEEVKIQGDQDSNLNKDKKNAR